MEITMKRVIPFFERIAMLLLCILMVDCCVSGSGRIVEFGSTGLRVVVFALTMLCAIPLMLQKFRYLLSSTAVWSIVLFVIWLLFETWIGLKNENAVDLILIDLKGFAYFALFPAAICILNSKDRIHILMKTMMYASGFLGLCSVIHLILFISNPDLFDVLYTVGLDLGFSGFNPITATIPRLFFYSTSYLLCGCAFATYFQVCAHQLNVAYPAITGINLFAILMTYTRSIYLSAIIAAAVLVVLCALFADKSERNKIWKHLGASVLAFCLILGSFSVIAKTDYFGYALFRTTISLETMTQPEEKVETPTSEGTIEGTLPPTDAPTMESTIQPTDPKQSEIKEDYVEDILTSDQTRSRTISELLKQIKKAPVVGSGLGFSLSFRNGRLHEFFWLDLLVKCGIVGFVLYLFPIFAMFVAVIRGWRKNQLSWKLVAPWLAVLLGFVAYSLFTPEMNCSSGILFYCCVAGVYHTIQNGLTAETNR